MHLVYSSVYSARFGLVAVIKALVLSLWIVCVLCLFILVHWILRFLFLHCLCFSSVLKREIRVCVFAQFSYRVSLLQLRRPQDWEAFGRELVSVLDQDGLLLGVSHPLHVDPHRPHRLPKALWGLVVISLVVWMWPGESLHSGPRDFHRPPLPWNTTLHYPQCLKWRIICCLLFYMVVFTLFYNVKLLIPWWWFFVLLLFLLVPLTHKVFCGLQVWK